MSDRLRATRIYIGNIRRNSRESDLRRVFDQVGPMESLVYYGDDEAYIEFWRHEDADYAIRKYDGYSFEGRRLLVEWALLSLNRSRDRRDYKPSYRERERERDSSYRRERTEDKKCYACGETGHFQKDCRGSRRRDYREEDTYLRRRNYDDEEYRRRDDYKRRDQRENSVQESKPKPDYRDERNSVRESVHESQAHKENDPRLQIQD